MKEKGGLRKGQGMRLERVKRKIEEIIRKVEGI